MRIEEQVEKVYTVMEKGGIALLPLDVAYALVCTMQEALQKIYELKRKPKEKRSVILDDKEIFEEIAPLKMRRYARGFTLPVGLIVPLSNAQKKLPEDTIHYGRIAIFINMGELGDKLAALGYKHGKLIYGSSANFSGAGNHFTLAEVEEGIRSNVDIELDGGESKYAMRDGNGRGLASTIIDIENDILVRKGILCERVISEARNMGLRIPNY